MRFIGCLTVMSLLCFGGTAFAQDAPPRPEPANAEAAEQAEMFEQMGMDPGAALFLNLLGRGKLDPMQLMLLMMMSGKGDMDEDAMGGLLLLQALSKGGAGAGPQWFQDDGMLFIIEDGTLYKINMDMMELEGQVAYKQGAGGGMAGLMQLLGPAMAQAREKALQTSCLSNMKQLCLGAMMYAQDRDEVFPGETWADDLFPYLQNHEIFVCPSRPELPMGYALNEKVANLPIGDIPNPAETVLLFESNIGGENPVGGVDDVPEDGVHNGGIIVGFVDGHAEWLPVDEARELLEREPF